MSAPSFALPLLLSSLAASADAPAQPVASAPVEVKRAENPKALANRYLVILSAAPQLDARPEVLGKLKAAGIEIHPMAVSTTDFKGLRPCLQVLAVGAFANKRQALAYAAKIESAGGKPSVRNTGKYVGRDEIRLASCAAPKQAVTATEPPRFVEVWLGRGFLPLDGGVPPSKPVKQSAADRHVWLGESEVREWAGAKVGDAWDVYANARFVQTCHVKGFVSLVREYAPFPLEDPPPTEPSCGSAQPFAELDCAPKGDDVFFALKHGTRAPDVWVEDMEDKDDRGVEREFREDDHFLAAQTRSKEEATPSTPYKESVTTRVFKNPKSTVVLVEGEVLTGDGNLCSSEDTYARFRLAAQFDTDGKENIVVPFTVVKNSGERFVAFTDTDGNGLAELLVRRGNTESALSSDGEWLSGKSVPYCDSDC